MEESEIRKQLAVEKFRVEINLLKFRSEKYNTRILDLDAKFIAMFQDKLRSKH